MNPHFGALRVVGYPISPLEHNKFKIRSGQSIAVAHDFREPVFGKCLYVLSGFPSRKTCEIEFSLCSIGRSRIFAPTAVEANLRESHDLSQRR